MIRYPNYRRATNAAYELLIHYASFSLATNVFAIAENFLGNCKLLTYGQASFLYGYTVGNLLEVSEFGFSIVNGDKRIILYNEAMPLGSIRFTIAHEIGQFHSEAPRRTRFGRRKRSELLCAESPLSPPCRM